MNEFVSRIKFEPISFTRSRSRIDGLIAIAYVIMIIIVMAFIKIIISLASQPSTNMIHTTFVSLYDNKDKLKGSFLDLNLVNQNWTDSSLN